MQAAIQHDLSGPGGRKKFLAVQGWTGINHSYAMVNQYQLLAMLQEPGVQLAHRQMPLFLQVDESTSVKWRRLALS